MKSEWSDPKIEKLNPNQLELFISMVNSYPGVSGGPFIDKRNVKGLRPAATKALIKELKKEMSELSRGGQAIAKSMIKSLS